MAAADPDDDLSYGQKVFRLGTKDVRLAVTETGGHLAPAAIRAGRRWIEPLSIAPWWQEKVAGPSIIRVLRGDFFCLPFGGNEKPHAGRQHPCHGATANDRWRRVGSDDTSIHLRQKGPFGIVDKVISLKPGQPVIYQKHTISGGSGKTSVGHHAMLKFRSTGLISVSPFVLGQVTPSPFEDPATGGYSSLKFGADFTSLDSVPLGHGGTTDLSRYPNREGYEDIVLMAADRERPFAWTAVAFPKERYLWIAFKNPRSLASTVLWHSNGGRHYAPWSGRHRAVLGLEEVTSYFAEGIAASATKNPLSARGIPTAISLSPKRATTISYIMAVVEIPENFQHVASVDEVEGGVEIVDTAGQRVHLGVDLGFL